MILGLMPHVNVHEDDQGTSAAAQPGVDGMTIRLSHDTCNAVNASYGASSFPGTQWEGFCTPSFTLSAVFMQDTWHGAFTAHHARGAQKPRAWWQAPHVSDEQDAKCRAPHVSDEQDATHAAWSPAGSRALTVMAAGRHAARSSVGASAPAAAALKSHPTVPVALPAPLCSVPSTSLPAMPVAPPTLTTHPNQGGWANSRVGKQGRRCLPPCGAALAR